MELITTATPAEKAGSHISGFIAEANADVVILLSGGSAMGVFEHITIDKSECRTIFMMGDERVTGEVETNNYLQLKERYFDHPLIEQVLDTSALVDETPEIFATRVKNIFVENISNLTEPKFLAVLGVGADGHTAGIFPMNEESFSNVYEADSTYVPVHLESLTIDSRASFTPNWILNSSDAVIGYIAGETKKQILNDLMNESKDIYERPAELFKRHKNSFIYTDIDVAKNDSAS